MFNNILNFGLANICMSHYRGFTLKPCLQYMSTIRHTAWALLFIVVVWCRSQIHKSHHAPVLYPTMHHSEQKYARFVSEWCIVGYRTGALWDLWDWFIPFVSVKVTSLGMGQSYDCFSANEATLKYMSAKFKLIHIEEQRKHLKKPKAQQNCGHNLLLSFDDLIVNLVECH